MRGLILSCILIVISGFTRADDGHRLWLKGHSTSGVKVICKRQSATLDIARQELLQGWQGNEGASVQLILKNDKSVKGDGFQLNVNAIQANTDLGILYGVYEMLRRQQTGQSMQNELCNPSFERRILNHWDNVDGTIERGYAGKSIFWRKENSFDVTEADLQLWKAYARANASVGINGSVLNNVKASPLMLTPEYL